MGKLWRGTRKLLRKRKIPAEVETLGCFLIRLHRPNVPRVLIQLVYYCLLATPVKPEDLVDSLEVFAGKKMFTKAFWCVFGGCWELGLGGRL